MVELKMDSIPFYLILLGEQQSLNTCYDTLAATVKEYPLTLSKNVVITLSHNT